MDLVKKFFNKITNTVDNWMYYVELNILIYLTSVYAIAYFSIDIIVPNLSVFHILIMMYYTTIFYFIILLLLIIHIINRNILKKHISYNVVYSKFYKYFWRCNIIANIVFHIFIFPLLFIYLYAVLYEIIKY